MNIFGNHISINEFEKNGGQNGGWNSYLCTQICVTDKAGLNTSFVESVRNYHYSTTSTGGKKPHRSQHVGGQIVTELQEILIEKLFESSKPDLGMAHHLFFQPYDSSNWNRN